MHAIRIGEGSETAVTLSSAQGIDRDLQEKSGHRGSDALPIDGRADLPVRPDLAAEQRLVRLRHGSIESLLPMPPYSATTFTDTNGVFRFVNLQPGRCWLHCHGLHGYYDTDGAEDPEAVKPIEVEPGGTRAGIDFVLPEIKKGVWTRLPFATRAPLERRYIYRTPEGLLWIDTLDYTLQAFDGRECKPFALSDEPNEVVRGMDYAPDGTLWIASASGINKLVKGQRQSVPWDDSLPRSQVSDVLAEPDGTVWFATASGLCQYDGRDFVTFSVQDGLPINRVFAVEPAADGGLWVGTEIGLAHYRDEKIEDLRQKLGIATGAVWEIRRDEGDKVWISSAQGLHILEPIPGHRGSDAVAIEGFRRISITATNGRPTGAGGNRLRPGGVDPRLVRDVRVEVPGERAGVGVRIRHRELSHKEHREPREKRR